MTTAAHFFPDTWMEQTSMGELYLSPERFSESKEARKSAHFMRRAWEKLGLEAILAYEGQPTIYFKSVPNFDPAFEAELHCLLWNQGTANLLLIRDRTKSVRVYSAFSPPSIQPIGSVESGDARLVETLCHIASALDLTEFLQRVETGRLYQSQRDLFSQETAVDETLLRNLRATAEQLCDVGGSAKLHRSEAHALLGRLLFTCYLRARGVLSDDYLKIAAGIELTGDRSDSPASINDILASYSSTDALDILFKIFTALKRDFNGSLFGNELEGERKAVRAAHMDVLRGFLNGDDLQTGQRALGFPAYDFSLIPVETISAIYEEFLKDEDPEDQNRKGAFYTPRHLAELAIDVATDSWDTLLDKKCLDPACGSGIFLVILFNRMAEEWRFRNPNAVNLRRAKALRQIMSENIWGIDLNPTACRIACFSLYLAFFDQLEPTDIWRLKRSLERENIKVLPPLLATIQKNFSETTEPRILSVNFFQNAIPIPSDFDLIVGNPPWIGRNQTTDVIAEDWLFSPDNTYLRSIVRTKKQSRACIMPEKQLAHAFMWKAPSHLKSQGRACLILPTKVWMNEKTNEFQNMWFKHFKIEHIIQLSDLRHLIFC